MTSHQSECPSLKSLQTITARDGGQKRKPSYFLGGNVTDAARVENIMEVP